MSIHDYMLEDFFKLAGLPKKGGFFNSANHAKYISGVKWNITLSKKDIELSYKLPALKESEKAVLFLGENVFSHGDRGRIPYEKIFIIDTFGVVRSYHVGGNGHGNHWYMSPDKVKLSFERFDSDCPEWVNTYDQDIEAENMAKMDLPELEEKRQVITGVITSIKETFNDYGMTIKALYQLNDGNKVYGTIPKNIVETAKINNKVSMNMTLKKKEAGFYFGSRPAKGEILE